MALTRQQIVSKLRSTLKLEQAWILSQKSLFVLSLSCCLLLTLTVTEAVLSLGMDMRAVLWYSGFVISASMFAFIAGPALFRFVGILPSEDEVTTALRVGRSYPEIADELSNALQLTDPTVATSDLSAAAFDDVSARSSELDYTVIIDKQRRSRFILAFALSSIAIVSIVGVSTPLREAAIRLYNHDVSYLPPAPFQLAIRVDQDTLMRGGSTTVIVRANGIPPQNVTVYVREKRASTFTGHIVQRDSSNEYRFNLPGLTESVQVFSAAPWIEQSVTSDTLAIIVIDRPLIRAFTGVVQPPSYARLASTPLTLAATDVTSLTGSAVRVNLESNKPLRTATVTFVRAGADTSHTDSIVTKINVEGAKASGVFRVVANGTYSIVVEDQDGLVSSPIRGNIVALTDSYPMIALLDPKDNVRLGEQAVVRMLASISDDFGFTGLKLYYRLTQSKYAQPEKNFRSIDVPIRATEITQEVGYLWDLAKIGITPDDTYEFYLEVADNDVVGGPKKARTSSVFVRMPSLDEVFADADKTQNEVQQQVKELVKEAESIRKEAEQLQREMQKQQSKQQQEVNWSDKKKAEELLKRQQELENKMDEASKKLEDMTQKLQENRAISQETLQKYQELQKLMQQVKTPELAKMQEELKKAMEQISPEEMQKMMKDFKFSEEEFRKNIERQLNLLKRMQAEQKTDELSKRAEELARKQDELRQRTEQSNPNNKQEQQNLAREQQQLKEEFDRLNDEAKELEKLMKDIGQDMPLDKMDQAQKDLDAQQTQQQMDQAQSDMEKGDNKSASEQQKQASQNMQRFAQQMKNMKREMRRNSQREAMRQMQKGVNDLLDVSKQQEALREQMKSLDPNSAQYAQMAQKQQRAQEMMQNIANSMMQLSQKSMSVSPEMAQDLGDALQNMKDAMQAMSERNGSQAMKSQQGAMSAMNSAAQKMSSALSNMMQGEGAGQGGNGNKPGQGEGNGPQSPYQRLQQLADQQQQINQGMQQLGQGQGMADQQRRAELGRLAQQQGKAMKAMQELEQERKNIVGEKEPLGDLKKIADDMKEVMSDMQSNSISSETRLRQERILSRLLDASRSMTERDYEKSRESNSGKDIRRTSPKEFELPTNQQQQNRTLLQQLKLGYTKDYENIIRQYYEAIQRQRLSNGERP